MRLLLVFSAILALSLTEARMPLASQYFGYKVFRATPKDMQQVLLLDKLSQNEDKFDFWTSPRGVNKPVDIMAKPSDIEELKSFLTTIKVPFNVMIDNVNENIRAQMVPAPKPEEISSRKSSRITFTEYHTYAEIQAFLTQTANDFPNIATKGSLGRSFEGRDIGYIKIGAPGLNKPAIWIDAGIHAREWISPATATYFIDQLTTGYGNDAEITRLVDDVDWIIVPSINPDGYAFTWSDDRLWRKSRSTNPGSTCLGTDPNRNYDFHWDEGGSSDLPCSDTYHGPSALSEIEAQHVSDFLLANRNSIKVYLTLHSYGQYWLTPWGYTSNYPSDYDNLFALATEAVAALTAVHGTEYTIGTSTNTLYVASGGSDDYAKGVAGIAYSYTVELRDTGAFGFTLPAALIIPTAEETWEGFKVVGNAVRDGLP